ncbi:hypothetical protein HN873_007921, partial [Arachis hypogaea]
MLSLSSFCNYYLQSRKEEENEEEEEDDEYGQRVVTRKHRGAVFESGFEENRYDENENENEDEEVDEARSPSGSPREDKDQIRDSAPEIRDVFGDFDDDEEDDGYAVHHDIEYDSNRSPIEEEGHEKGLRPEDILADEDHRYGSEEENYEMKTKEKPLGPPLELEVSLQPPPALPEKEKYDNTVKECTKALDLNPVYIKALVRRGEAHEKLEHFEEAIAVKTCPYEKRSVPIQQQQQQLLLNGKEIRNSDELRAIGVKDDNLFVMVRFGVGSGGGGAASCLVDEELSKK